jgi:E3 ubiquitin-protein ligase HERC2
MQAQEDGKVDRGEEGGKSIFGAVSRKLKGSEKMRMNSSPVFRVNFAHERGIDQGGPYREIFHILATELQSSTLSLLVRCPNHEDDKAGITFRDRWNPNPAARSASELALYEFLGSVMGIVLRGAGDENSEVVLPIDLPPIIWKLIIKQPVTIKDVLAINNALGEKLKLFAEHDVEYCSAVAGEDLTFTAESSQPAASGLQETVALVAGGEAIPVTNENKDRYLRLMQSYYLSEFDEQVAAIRRGLAQVVPIETLHFFSWHEFEIMVCGTREVDLCVLKQATRYEGVDEGGLPVKLFWQAMESFSHAERRLFLQFVWARSRMPQSAAKFPQAFKIHGLSKRGALPMSHTCFFQLDLPTDCETLEVMQKRLRTAFTMSGAFGEA